MSPLFRSRRTATDEADDARRRAHGEPSRARIGIIGVVVTVLVMIVALQMDRLPFLSNGSVYSTYFDDAGGLAPGDSVVVAGVEVGKVQSLKLARTSDGPKVKIVFNVSDTIKLGTLTQARIKTETVLGRRNLTLNSDGTTHLKPGGTIPNSNTVAPYTLTDALDQTTSTLQATDKKQLTEALDSINTAFANTPPMVRSAVDGVSRLSKTIADRDDALSQLLQKANDVSGVLRDRSNQVNQLLVNANSLLGVVQDRRTALDQLISGIKNVTAQLSGFVQDNNAQLKPVLDKLNGVVDILQHNDGALRQTIDQLGPYANQLGEAVASGPYFNSFAAIPTIGDYSDVVLNLLEQQYPKAFQAFLNAVTYQFGIQPPAATMPPPNNPAPTNPTPQPNLPLPRVGGPSATTPAPTYQQPGR
ncbi:MCE family protein [Jongsikchunia kroppenstedtii]|uniref:MCE family protein n=1 Tax=Jongsikchunia kroppenstedtii TaxID=1121721 RepID=UPI000363E49E|nr:MCE family protein [Jongsikchunia kroppenstedtii]